MPNEKIVQALRVCGSMMNCTECPLENKDWCTRTMMLSAADLIEQQMEEVTELTEGIKKLEKLLAAFGQANKELREIVPEWTPNVLRLAELFLGVRAGRLRVLAQADKEQRVVVLPVPPRCSFSTNNILYIIDDGEIYEDSLYEATVGESERGYTNVIYTTLDSQIDFEQADIGKTVFLTREAAERALVEAE